MANDKREPEKSHARKVVSSNGMIKDPPFWRKLARIFITDDPEEAVKRLIKHVVEPNLKKGAVDAFATVVLGHPVTGSSPVNTVINNTPTDTNKTSYFAFGSGSQAPLIPSGAPINGGARFNGTVYFDTYEDADALLQELHRILIEYKRVRLLELYEAGNIPGSEYVSNNWGWTDLTGARIITYGNGYLLQLPEVRVLP